MSHTEHGNRQENCSVGYDQSQNEPGRIRRNREHKDECWEKKKFLEGHSHKLKTIKDPELILQEPQNLLGDIEQLNSAYWDRLEKKTSNPIH